MKATGKARELDRAEAARTRATADVSMDVVVPVFDEEEVVPALAERLRKVFAPDACAANRLRAVRILFVDDGSRDGTVAAIRANMGDLPATIIRFSRNFGHQAAVTAGLEAAGADVVAVMDGDLQDPPEVLIDMLAAWRQGYDVAYGVRKRREGSRLKRFGYWLFYRIYHALSPVDVPVDSGDFCLMSRRVVEELRRMPETQRFTRGLRSWVGFLQTGVEYERPERTLGQSKYTFRRLYELATDGIAALSIRPLQLAQLIALGYLVVTFFLLAAIVASLARGSVRDVGLAVVVAVNLLSNAVILVCLHILGAYVGRAYFEVKGRPNHIVRDVIDAGPAPGR